MHCIKKILICLIAFGFFSFGDNDAVVHVSKQRLPNILFAIADDQSYPHAGAYGTTLFKTPAFDSIAAAGVLFNNAFVAAPQCSPSRAAILTGKHIWQLEEAGTHSSYFPKKFPVFTTALAHAGYFLGYTGKAWDPGNFKDAGWAQNPVGPEYNKRTLDRLPTKGISPIDYVANFRDFISDKPADQPFFFWYGSKEPHRVFEQGSGEKSGLALADASVPRFLPDDGVVRGDMLDYALEIGWFDQQLSGMLSVLKERGELENTIVVVTADNGMAFPYAKANLQEFGTHVPLAICGPAVQGASKKGITRKVDDLVSLIDIAPTLLEMAGVPPLPAIAGRSLVPLLSSPASGTLDASRSFVLTGRERHTHARPDNLGYPARAIRTKQYLYIKNYAADRWPAGDPPPQTKPIQPRAELKPVVEGYEDIDSSPTKVHMLNDKNTFPQLFDLAFGKRKAEQLFDIAADPFCLQDLSGQQKMAGVQASLKEQLETQLLHQGDPRSTGKGDVFEGYPRFGAMKAFEGFSEKGSYNPRFTASPNIILILLDDLGWSSLSSKMDDDQELSRSDFYETPYMDKLSRQGLRFTRGYSPDPICSPTRRSLLYGQSSIRQGEDRFVQQYGTLQGIYQSIPQVLKKANKAYRTAHFGKWDLRAKITPEQVGYDYSDGDNGNKMGNEGSNGVAGSDEKWGQHFVRENPKQIDSLTDRSIRFMRDRAKSGEPFYLQVSHFATHANMETRQTSYEKFATKPLGKKHSNAAWAAMLYDLDQAIGKLMKEVEILGLAEHTYIFLTVDNGAVEFVPPVSNRLDPPAAFSAVMRNHPLRGGKWTLYEGGIRVPFMVAGPGIEPGQTAVPVIGWDLLPTFYALAGGKDVPAAALDGGNFAPLLFNRKGVEVKRAADCFYFHRFHNTYPHSVIIKGNDKLIKFWKTGKTELYDLVADPGESNNLFTQKADIARDLEAQLLQYMHQVNPELLSKFK
ncbi:MAG: sulfatase-like hydrolase/transferase [Bacteroidetes bacterium]|nr:sulfatase-like hydrolase/transferase [Bacteroidota bacterium]